MSAEIQSSKRQLQYQARRLKAQLDQLHTSIRHARLNLAMIAEDIEEISEAAAEESKPYTGRMDNQQVIG